MVCVPINAAADAGIAGLLTAVLALNLPGIILVALGFTLTVNHIG